MFASHNLVPCSKKEGFLESFSLITSSIAEGIIFITDGTLWTFYILKRKKNLKNRKGETNEI